MPAWAPSQPLIAGDSGLAPFPPGAQIPHLQNELSVRYILTSFNTTDLRDTQSDSWECEATDTVSPVPTVMMNEWSLPILPHP